MVLVGQYDSPFVRRVAVTLHRYAMPFTRNTMSVFGDAKDMQKINPLIRIPSLVLDSGETLIDSVAIIDTLDEIMSVSSTLARRSARTGNKDASRNSPLLSIDSKASAGHPGTWAAT